MSLDACVFKKGTRSIVLDHALGNISRIQNIREEFERLTGTDVDDLCDKLSWPCAPFGYIAFTIRNGCHCMDCIPEDTVPRLKRELLSMPRGTDTLEIFRAQMIELCDAAIAEGGAIEF